jgi:hypothetical protein
MPAEAVERKLAAILAAASQVARLGVLRHQARPAWGGLA